MSQKRTWSHGRTQRCGPPRPFGVGVSCVLTPCTTWVVVCQVAASSADGSKGLSMKAFQDPSLSSGVFLLHLLSTIRGIVNWDLVSRGSTPSEKQKNCQYVIRSVGSGTVSRALLLLVLTLWRRVLRLCVWQCGA